MPSPPIKQREVYNSFIPEKIITSAYALDDVELTLFMRFRLRENL